MAGEEADLKKLDNYSGEFIHDLKPEDFSADALARLVRLYSKLYIGLDGLWYLTLKERMGNEEALACDIQAWEKITRYEMKNITRELDIQGNDVVAFMKGMQLSPWSQRMEHNVKFQGRDKALFTVTSCPTLDALEKEGKGREDQICNIVDVKWMQDTASFFNPAIKVTPLKTPPRKSREEICCQWEIILEDQGGSGHSNPP